MIGGGIWATIYILKLIGFEYLPQTPYFDALSFTSLQLTLLLLLNLISVAAAFTMWHLRKAGFYIYFATQFLLFNLPLLFTGSKSFDLNELFFTTLFIFFYGINLGIMKK